jgi:hypothetical protein
MPAPSNLSFETAGAGAGEASGWTLTPTSTFEELADFGTPAEPWERFESGWDNDTYLFAFAPVNLQNAQMTTLQVTIKTVEDFEELWSNNQSFLWSLDSPEPEEAVFDAAPEDREDFEEGWDSNEAYLTAFVGVGTDLEAAVWDAPGVAETFDSFEAAAGWSAGYITAFAGVGVDLSAATFDNVGNTVDAFELVKAPTQVTIDPLNDQFDVDVSHPFADGDKVTILTSIYPAPLQSGKAYYVAFSGLTHFQIENGIGAGVIDLVETAADAVYVTADARKYWIDLMVTTAF